MDGKGTGMEDETLEDTDPVIVIFFFFSEDSQHLYLRPSKRLEEEDLTNKTVEGN